MVTRFLTDICNIENETSTNDFVDGQFSANYLLGVKYSLSQEGTLNAIKLIGNDSGSGVQMAVYDDNGGVPNNLIAYSAPSIVGDGLTFARNSSFVATEIIGLWQCMQVMETTRMLIVMRLGMLFFTNL